MNNSTEGVTLDAVFINDVLSNYDKSKYPELYQIVDGVELKGNVPMDLYNDLCMWIEQNLGKFNLIKVGRTIGETVYTQFLKNDLINADSKPIDIIKALKLVASQMIQDPQGRGWEIVSDEPKKIVVRRTQTFNGKLQLGLLDGLVRKSKATGVRVDFTKEVELGDEFDEYQISWL
ncbi:hypothetical protein OO013_17560 [Mangrovivirga sp. M17]|uniref:Uncharacterized protein n=1 Tax=Mangrovivirga halotolerans TaxID=2993936 RepID=A0ABT3RVB5_9BACT|nr:hypothetical protein [Mangrovivirga halotolerans]MCX2745694.1 hypothetical protein [Mangrovivirga halotolerans]